VPEITDITIIGQMPSWVKGTHIPYEDTTNAVANIWGKLAAIHETEPFLFMNDDYFFTQPTATRQIPIYYDCDIQDKIDNTLKETYRASGKYAEMLQRTREVLLSAHLSTLNTALHYPVVIYPKVLQQCLAFPNNTSFRCIYGNLTAQPKKQQRDCKLFKSEHYDSQPIFSISDRFLDKTGVAIIEGLYPDKCKFEL
jgi:hypothetical protein